ncbi:CPBP family intramembrane glutamic endopeptidase [uncultured Alistipes sp.]|uniref:CPBP family intramembrane glutamic endopeptidase n=1 Tax=uncultured Alistipes sp. TaxID=538949 RepID=UPI0025E3024B|nr:CPBP family intramembrane glutamic endopeptidase [uncultured Alistipes sp.]
MKTITQKEEQHAAACGSENKNHYICISEESEGSYPDTLFETLPTGFFWAVILPALYFGSVHLYQGHDLLSALAAFGVTFIGALYFSWMYVEWNFNLWIPAGLHILMNGAWHVFTMEGTEVAAGGLISNTARIISIALAIALTVHHHKRKGEKVFDYPIWRF